MGCLYLQVFTIPIYWFEQQISVNTGCSRPTEQCFDPQSNVSTHRAISRPTEQCLDPQSSVSTHRAMFPLYMFPFYISFSIFSQLIQIFSFKSEDGHSKPDKSENKDKNSIAIGKNQSCTVSQLIPIIISKEQYLSPSLKQSLAEQLIQFQKQRIDKCKFKKVFQQKTVFKKRSNQIQ